MSTLLTWLPDELAVLGILLIGFALMLRIVSLRCAMGLLGGFVFLLLAGPFLDALIETLPWWLTALLAGMVLLALLRWFFSLFLGGAAADHMTGILGASAVLGIFRLALLPFRVVGWLLARR